MKKRITFSLIGLLAILSVKVLIAQTSNSSFQFYQYYKNAVADKTAIINANPELYQQAINNGWFQQVEKGLKNAQIQASGNGDNGGGPQSPASNNGTCANATPFCTSGGATYPAGVNTGSGESGPNYGCLGSEPNPAWFYMKILTGGDLHITETNSNNIDVDFILWGPFTSPTCGSALSAGKIVDCSYSSVATEYIDIASCIAGEYYMLLITNFSNNNTQITLAKTSGSAETDCAITLVPQPPTATAGTSITGSTFYANWTPAPGDPYPATSFVIDVSTDPGFGSFVGSYNNLNVGNVSTYQVTGLSPGNTYYYRLRGVNADGQSLNSNTITVNTLNNPSANASVLSNVSCNGGSNGSCTVSATDGTPPYTFAWSTSPVQTTQTVTGLTAGTWYVTVTDAGSGSTVASATVTEPPALTAVASTVTHVNCYGYSNGSVTVSPGGGVSPYTFSWSTSPVQTTQTASSLPAGTYWVTVTDSHSCTATSSTTVTQPAQWWPGLSGPTPVCQNITGNVYQTESGNSNYSWTLSAGGVATNGGSSTDNSIVVTWTGSGAQTVSVNYLRTSDGCYAYAPGVYPVTVNPAPTPVVSGATTVHESDIVTYSTPYVAGHTYSWSVSSGNASICFPQTNCITVTWNFPCGIISPGYVNLTETITATGCATTVNKVITVLP